LEVTGGEWTPDYRTMHLYDTFYFVTVDDTDHHRFLSLILFSLNKYLEDWSIWTGSLEQNGHFSAIDNKCQSEVSQINSFS